MEIFGLAPLLINFFLLLYVWKLSNKIKVLRRENKKLLLKHFDDLEQEIKHKLDSLGEMHTIKFLRMEKGMSLVDAKQIVDSIKKSLE